MHAHNFVYVRKWMVHKVQKTLIRDFVVGNVMKHVTKESLLSGFFISLLLFFKSDCRTQAVSINPQWLK